MTDSARDTATLPMTLDGYWQDMQRQMIPANATAAQIDFARMAFHCGFLALFDIWDRALDLTEAEEQAVYAAIEKECQAYLHELQCRRLAAMQVQGGRQ